MGWAFQPHRCCIIWTFDSCEADTICKIWRTERASLVTAGVCRHPRLMTASAKRRLIASQALSQSNKLSLVEEVILESLSRRSIPPSSTVGRLLTRQLCLESQLTVKPPASNWSIFYPRLAPGSSRRTSSVEVLYPQLLHWCILQKTSCASPMGKA
jgi:hypothetical protein